MARSLKERALAGGGMAGRLAEVIGEQPIDRVAEEAGIDRSTLRHHLGGHGKRGPGMGTMIAIEAAVARLRGGGG